MYKAFISQESVLSAAKEMVCEKDLQDLNMRNVAKKCKVAVGSIYNYFPSKSDLIIATIGSIWKEIMSEIQEIDDSADFIKHVNSVFCCIQAGCKKYPNFFSAHLVSASSVDLSKARIAMNQYMSHIKNAMLNSLGSDMAVKASAFNESFSKNDLVEFVFSNIISTLMKKESSCTVLLEVISRVIY